MSNDKVFICYSKKDKKWLTRLKTMLKPFERTWDLILWDDSKISPGKDWNKEINKALQSATVAVFLVSPDFLASEFINSIELPRLLDAGKAGKLSVCWILLSYCAYETTPLASLQAAHDISKPLDTLRLAQQNKTLTEISRYINELIHPPQKIKLIHRGLKTKKTEFEKTTIDLIDGEIVKDQSRIEPLEEFTPWPIIESYTYNAKINFPFYISRESDELIGNYLSGNSFITILGGKQTGKSTLSIRNVLEFRKQGFKSMYSNFGEAGKLHLNQLSLQENFVNDLIQQLNIPQELVPQNYFENATINAIYYLITETIDKIKKPILLALDDLDSLPNIIGGEEFLIAIESWLERIEKEPRLNGLKILATISSHSNIITNNQILSLVKHNPIIELSDLNLKQIEELSLLHNVHLSQSEISNMHQVLGGHPYLIRLAIYVIWKEKCEWTDLLTNILTKESAFSKHIGKCKALIKDDRLDSALQQIISSGECANKNALHLLMKYGIITSTIDNHYRLRAGLYNYLLL